VNRKLLAFVSLAVVLGLVFVRLGFWQLERRHERRAANARVTAQLARDPVPLATLPADSSALDRRATVRGTPDYDHEFVVTGRSRRGSPGVHIFTPIRVYGSDTAVLVNRGWVYSPDAATVSLGRWRETQTTYSGYTEMLSGAEGAFVRGRGLRPLTRDGVRALVPYPVSPVYLVARDSGHTGAPARLDIPVLSDGPHLSYAIQWFAFAAIALVGAAFVVHRGRLS
jgi:surfeit locus 1 family protein